MKQTYTQAQLLCLRHECQVPSVASYFSSLKPCWSSSHSQPNFQTAPGVHNEPGYFAIGAAQRVSSFHPYVEMNKMPQEGRVSGKHGFKKSYDLIQLPANFADLPPGSKIVKAQPGVPMPANAIPISISEPSYCDSRGYRTVTLSPIESARNNWTPLCVEGYKGYCDDVENISMSAVGGKSCPLDKWNQSEAMEAKHMPPYNYAHFFEPYMRKPSHAANSDGAVDMNMSPVIRAKTSTLDPSCDSQSTASYSSDSSNIQIQLPN